jgi:signal transduction histidine kinase
MTIVAPADPQGHRAGHRDPAFHRERPGSEPRALQHRLLFAEERDRRRIAQDMHDGVQTRLVLIAGSTRKLLDEHLLGAEPRELLSRVHTEIEAAIADIRNLVLGIMPPALVDRGLAAAVEDLSDRMPVPVRFRVRGRPCPYPSRIESVAYFVAAEGLANVLKHAGASRARVELRHREDGLAILVEDDGSGGARLLPGRGLEGLSSRVRALDGALRLESNPSGTLLRADLPCECS